MLYFHIQKEVAVDSIVISRAEQKICVVTLVLLVV